MKKQRVSRRATRWHTNALGVSYPTLKARSICLGFRPKLPVYGSTLAWSLLLHLCGRRLHTQLRQREGNYSDGA